MLFFKHNDLKLFSFQIPITKKHQKKNAEVRIERNEASIKSRPSLNQI